MLQALVARLHPRELQWVFDSEFLQAEPSRATEAEQVNP